MRWSLQKLYKNGYPSFRRELKNHMTHLRSRARPLTRALNPMWSALLSLLPLSRTVRNSRSQEESVDTETVNYRSKAGHSVFQSHRMLLGCSGFGCFRSIPSCCFQRSLQIEKSSAWGPELEGCERITSIKTMAIGLERWVSG